RTDTRPHRSRAIEHNGEGYRWIFNVAAILDLDRQHTGKWCTRVLGSEAEDATGDEETAPLLDIVDQRRLTRPRQPCIGVLGATRTHVRKNDDVSAREGRGIARTIDREMVNLEAALGERGLQDGRHVPRRREDRSVRPSFNADGRKRRGTRR